MARKKRSIVTTVAPEPDAKNKPRYRDSFQQNVGKKVEEVGKQLEVIVDGPDPEVPNHMLARSHADAPDIDCLVRVKGKGLAAGDLVQVKVTAADGYDLVARAIKSE